MEMPEFVVETASWFELGDVLELAPLAEGFSHSVFSLRTTDGRFVLKRLNPDLSVGGHPVSVREAAKIELVALAGGVPAPKPVLDGHGEAVVRQQCGEWTRVHHWVPGRTRQSELASRDEVDHVVRVLALLHSLKIPVSQDLDIEVPNDWQELASYAATAAVPWASELAESVGLIAESSSWASDRPEAPMISSHRDIYPRNVLFSGRLFQILDWDLAGPTSVDEELAVAAVEWSGGIVGPADTAAIRSFVGAYQSLSGHNLTVDRSLFGRWLTRQLRWLDYHIRKSVEQSQGPTDEVALRRVGFLLPRLNRQLSELDDWLAALDSAAS